MEYSSVSRHYIFVLQRGAIVVRLSEDRVQELATDRQYDYVASDFGHGITDVELRTLQQDGLVGQYSADKVDIPRHIADLVNVGGHTANHIRAYYIVTAIPAAMLSTLEMTLDNLTVPHVVEPRVAGGVVGIYGRDGNPFTTLHDAEEVLKQLRVHLPDLLQGATISVYEVAHAASSTSVTPTDAALSTQAAKRVATDNTPTKDKMAVIVARESVLDVDMVSGVLVDDLGMHLHICYSAAEAIPVIEDHNPDILLVDLQLPDTHGWSFIRKLRELPHLKNLNIVVFSSDQNDMVIALKVVRVSGFVQLPLASQPLRKQVWVTLNTAGE